MGVLPGHEKKKKTQKRTGPSDMAANDDGPVWEDLPSLIEALSAHQVYQAQADQEQPKPAVVGVEEEGEFDPLVQAVVAIEGAHISYQSKPKPLQTQACLVCLLYTHAS